MKKIKVLPSETYGNYSQIGQTKNCGFSIADYNPTLKIYQEVYRPFTCREYFGDILLATILDVNTPNCNSFSAKPIKFDKGMGLLSLTVYADEMWCIEKMVKVINELEKILHFKRTKVVGCDLESGKVIIKFNKRWTRSPLLLSAYTWLFRLSLYSYAKKVFESVETGSFDPSTLLTLQNKIVADYKYSHTTDGEDFNALSIRNVCLTDIILNQKELFKTNPITGIDDATFISELSDPKKLEDYDYTFYIGDDSCPKTRISKYSIHTSVGCVSFAYSYGNISDNGIYGKYMGHDWAIALKKIKGKK